jgi:hypothetical protein
MNAHFYAYLKNLSWEVLGAAAGLDTRAAQRAAVIAAVQQFPTQHRSFIADCAWSGLGYGGGI